MSAALTDIAAVVAADRIRNLKCRYFRCVDTHDWAGLSDLFCADAEFDTRRSEPDPAGATELGRLARGRDAILAFISEGLADAISFHGCMGHEVHVESGTEASGVVALEDRVVWGSPPAARMHGFGHYHERYRCEAGGWRIWRSRLVRLPLTRHHGI